jgi:PAS domain S-box-containing protein
MQWSHKLSLRRKITSAMMINTFAALCVASLAFAEYGVYRFKQMQMQDLNALGNVIATNSTAALAFKDQKSAGEVLQALSAKPHILAATIYDPDGKPFAVYHRGTSQGKYTPPPVESDSSRFTANRMLIFQKITLEGEKVGNIFLEGDTVEYQQLLEGYLLFFGLILVAVTLGAYAMAERLQRPIADPILKLAWTAKLVTGSRDYSIRAGKQSQDEVGVLIDGFNEMLAQIQIRDAELSSSRDDLEQRVEERTRELEQEVADRQRAQEALLESEGKIRLILESTAEAINGIDENGICTFCNPAALRLLGYQNPEDLVGKKLHGIMHHTRADGTPYPEEDCAIYTSIRDGNGIHSDEEVFWRADGTSFPAEYWAHPIRREGNALGAVVTFLDITERKRAQESLRKSKEAAEAGSRAKSEFLANMSHEIRTPMNGIIGMTDLALDTPLTSEQREYLSLVKSSANSLLHLINDILDFSKIEAGKFELEGAEFKIRDLFSDTLKTLAVRASQKHLGLSCRVADDVPIAVIGDSTRLRQLIVNLVGNAIKFTEHGNIGVDTELESQTSDAVQLHLRVSDTGIGIPLEKQQLIFESFAQADGSTTRRFGGTGLGLTISRRIVELMGGRMWVESEVDKGSVFHFTITLRHASAQTFDSPRTEYYRIQGVSDLDANDNQSDEAASGLEAPQERRLNILLAEDNSVNQKLAIRLLEKAGHSVVLAATGKEALKLLEQALPPGFDVALMDIQMPEMGGLEAAAAIRDAEKSSGQHLPIIAITANAMSGDRERYLTGGMDGYISKPIDARGLFAEIRRCLTEMKKNTTIKQQPAEHGEHLDRATVLERVEGDQELLADMIQLFLADAPQLLGVMRHALQQGDMILLERSAHSMKGAAGNFSAKVTLQAASLLEQSAKAGDTKSSDANLAALEGAVQRLLPVLADLCQGVPK